jgi:hypothetical protein
MNGYATHERLAPFSALHIGAVTAWCFGYELSKSLLIIRTKFS